ncbi:protein CHROMATIN REMODELING 20 [Dorcoceras hygrometricum]|uniref:Protein CHROMATIN REMODELING 20 n=1 Tax=Dorcoceras hygrometricum TaxID=472368 RepID=A0A2Z7C467_9LAMI|nr:protein CHROMATIN REMODELING 20 [Dorcoceras hygrometricum]
MGAEKEERNEEEIGDLQDDSSNESVEIDEEGDEEEEEEEAEPHSEQPVTDKDIDELIAELLEVEGKAAEAQEALEEESLLNVRADVRKELAVSLSGDDLEKAVAEEMAVFKEEWELELDELETESAHLLEQLDGAGVELSSVYKWIEKQAPSGCCTEAWKKRAHWVGTQLSLDAVESVSQAEEYLKIHRPVRRRHGKILEEGASGFLAKKVVASECSPAVNDSADVDWNSFSKMCSDGSGLEDVRFGSKQWASVYLASTPQQAAELGLKFPGVDEVEEIDDVDGMSSDPFVADAVANERDLRLTEEQKRNFRKVKEEDDANTDLELHIRLKRRRLRKQSKKDTTPMVSPIDGLRECQLDISLAHDEVLEDGTALQGTNNEKIEFSGVVSVKERAYDGTPLINGSASPGLVELTDVKHTEVLKSEGQIASSSDSASDDSDTDGRVTTCKRRRKKKIRRILDDAELGEETKMKIAIEKERQERLKSLEARIVTNSMIMSSMVRSENSFDGAGSEMLGDTSAGYVINVVREEGEEAVRIPPSICTKLKPHQIAGIRFMWENIIQSVRKVRSGDKGLGCILAHTMGLGKTFQVIAFLYTAMRSVDLGLKTALIVTPVSVLHNWRHEFLKWRPSELKPLRIFMLEDVLREKRIELLTKWRSKGGVFLIGYSAFRNLSLGKYVKDRELAKEISRALQDGPHILVCDEAHMIKNTRADTTQALKQVKSQRRIALTGSPLQNNLMEYYCMVDFVREGFLGSSHEFRNRFQNPIENGQHTNSTALDVKIMNQRSHILYEELKGFVQRMDMNVIKSDLPPKTVFVITVKLSPLQRKLYKRFLDVHGFTKEKVSKEKLIKRSFFAGYQALAQIWNHPGILQLRKENKDSSKYEDVESGLADDSSSDDVDYNISGYKLSNSHQKNENRFLNEDWWRDLLHENNYEVDYSGKMVLLLDILKMCSCIGDKALVFSQSLLTLDLIEFYLSKLPRPRKNGKLWKKGKDWYRFDGRTESSERQKLVERFNEPSNRRVKCTLISTRAGSLGINLHAANRVIIVDGSWNPTYDLQAIYRVWRYGQMKPVFAYRLLAHATMEEKIYKRQVTKEGLAARVVDRQQVHRTMSKEEILHLFEFGDDENTDAMLPVLGEETGFMAEPNMAGQNSLNHKLQPPNGSASFDKIFQSLIDKHHPSWISNYHEHETLLQENEEEKLSKEEQDLAWEVYRKTIEWEETRRCTPEESILEQQKILINASAPGEQLQQAESTIDQSHTGTATGEEPVEDYRLERIRQRHRNRFLLRHCTNLSHLMTLRSQRIKEGGRTICGQCAREIRWENLKPDSRMTMSPAVVPDELDFPSP